MKMFFETTKDRYYCSFFFFPLLLRSLSHSHTRLQSIFSQTFLDIDCISSIAWITSLTLSMMNANMIALKLIKSRDGHFFLHNKRMIKAFAPQSEQWMPVEHNIPHRRTYWKEIFSGWSYVSVQPGLQYP